MILGIYSGDIIVSAAPSDIELCLYVEFADVPVGKHIFELEIVAAGNKVQVSANGESHTAGVVAMPLPKMLIHLEGDDELVFRYRYDNGKWKTGIKKKIIIGGIQQA